MILCMRGPECDSSDGGWTVWCQILRASVAGQGPLGLPPGGRWEGACIIMYLPECIVKTQMCMNTMHGPFNSGQFYVVYKDALEAFLEAEGAFKSISGATRHSVLTPSSSPLKLRLGRPSWRRPRMRRGGSSSRMRRSCLVVGFFSPFWGFSWRAVENSRASWTTRRAPGGLIFALQRVRTSTLWTVTGYAIHIVVRPRTCRQLCET